jgi:hypothetical protein
VTLSARVDSKSALPSETHGEIIGRADDGKGVEAMVVSIGGTTDRPDGAPIISPGRSAKAGGRRKATT